MEYDQLYLFIAETKQEAGPYIDAWPALYVLFGLLSGEDYGESIAERDGPAYGWVPMLCGGAVLGAALWYFHAGWAIWAVALLLLYPAAASTEQPLMRRLVALARPEWAKSFDTSSFELVVPATLVAWAVVEFTVGTPGTHIWWAATTGYLAEYVFFAVCFNVFARAAETVFCGGLLFLVAVPAIAGGMGILDPSSTLAYLSTIVFTFLALRRSGKLPVEFSRPGATPLTVPDRIGPDGCA